MRKAKVVELSRDEARAMQRAGTLPTGHATLSEMCDPSKTVFHIAGTAAHDYRIRRNGRG